MASAPLAGLTAGAAQAARDTLGGAVAVAAQLPDAPRAALLTVAHAAFTEALQRAALLSAVLVIATAILTLIFLRPASED